jgi:hypothetical protein
MARCFLLATLVLAALGLPLAAQTVAFASGDAGLDATLSSLNVQASADIGSFTAQLSADFGVKQVQIQTWMKAERLQPAEIYLLLELGRIAKKPPAAVLEIYKPNRRKGWGAVAQSLGIKPGSREFKALKAAASGRDKKLRAKKKK